MRHSPRSSALPLTTLLAACALVLVSYMLHGTGAYPEMWAGDFDEADYRFVAEHFWGLEHDWETYDKDFANGWGALLSAVPFRDVGVGTYYLATRAALETVGASGDIAAVGAWMSRSLVLLLVASSTGVFLAMRRTTGDLLALAGLALLLLPAVQWEATRSLLSEPLLAILFITLLACTIAGGSSRKPLLWGIATMAAVLLAAQVKVQWLALAIVLLPLWLLVLRARRAPWTHHVLLTLAAVAIPVSVMVVHRVGWNTSALTPGVGLHVNFKHGGEPYREFCKGEGRAVPELCNNDYPVIDWWGIPFAPTVSADDVTAFDASARLFVLRDPMRMVRDITEPLQKASIAPLLKEHPSWHWPVMIADVIVWLLLIAGLFSPRTRLLAGTGLALWLLPAAGNAFSSFDLRYFRPMQGVVLVAAMAVGASLAMNLHRLLVSRLHIYRALLLLPSRCIARALSVEQRWAPYARSNVGLLALAIAAIGMFFLTALSGNHVGSASVSLSDGSATGTVLPVSRPSGDPALTVTVQMRRGPLAGSSLHIIPDDCLESLTVNGAAYTGDDVPFCDFVEGKTINLGDRFHRGWNTVQFFVTDESGAQGLDLRRTWNATAILLSAGWILLFIAGMWIFCCRRLHTVQDRAIAAAVAALGALCIIYMLGTHYEQRAHDVGGHIEYIRYILQHGSLPHPSAGWETYQPPLYYVTSGVFIAIANAFVAPFSFELIAVAQALAACFVIAGIAVLGWIGRYVFPGQRRLAVLFLLLCGTLPGVIFLAGRINNDVLLFPLQIAAVGLLLLWWRSGKASAWYGMHAVIGLGMLTKSNAILLVTIAMLCLLFRNGIPWRKRIIQGVLGLLIAGGLAGGVLVPRMLQSDEGGAIVGNINALNSGLRVSNAPEDLLALNPIGILLHPFNNPWDDAQRRNEFPEYLFRSAFFGEFEFSDRLRPLAQVLLAAGMAVGFCALMGMLRGLLQRKAFDVPMIIAAVVLFLGHLAFRITHPFSSSQDFRYSIPLLIPVAYFFCSLLHSLPPRWRRAGEILGFGTAAGSMGFVLAVLAGW